MPEAKKLPRGGLRVVGSTTDDRYLKTSSTNRVLSELTPAAVLADIGGGAPTVSFGFITGVSGAGTITNKVFETNTVPANKILESFESDNDNITVELEIAVIANDWQPATITVSGAGATPVVVNKENWTQVGSTRIFTATANLTDADTSGTITATLSDGDTATVTYTRGLDSPLVTAAAWDGNYPASQTQVKSGDSVTLTGTLETHATRIRVESFGATSSVQDFDDDYSSGTFSISVTIGSGAGSKQFRLKANKDGGSFGATFDTTDSPAIDLSQTSPTFGSFSVNYNGSQEAMKGAETCAVTLVHSNIAGGDTYLYSDPTTPDDITIPATSTYAATKTGVTINTASIYRDDSSPNNFRLTVTRTTQNGKSASASGTVEVADVAALIKLDDSSTTYASGGSITRMGTDNGSNNYRDRNLYVISNQKHLGSSTSSVAPDAADTSAFIASWVEDDDFTFRRSFRVEDADINAGGQAANDFSWASPTVTNRAGTVTSSITKNPNYSIGGFQARTLTIPAWTNREVDLSVFAVNTSKLAAELLSKGGDGPNGGTVQVFDNSPGSGTPDNEVDKFCITDGADAVDDDGSFYYNKDQAAAIANSSGTAQVIVEETP